MTPCWTPEADYPSFREVATTAKQSGAAGSAKSNNLPFEEALNKLESIVDTMEEGDLPLETLLTRYEEGTRLIRICQTKLAEAEIKIKKLEKTAAGTLELKPIDAEADE